MRILVATDAWHPQVNGVVRTLGSLARAADKLGAKIDFLTPEGFPSFQLPTYPGLRLAWPSRRGIEDRVEARKPDAIHIATEGPVGFAVRAYCRRHGRRFTTSYTTRFPEYISARLPIPSQWVYAVLRWFHSAATVTMVATPSLMTELTERGFGNLGMWTRGVDVDLFRPDRAIELDLPRPIFMTVGRVAVEKNLEAFLSLDLPGTKVVVGSGPAEAKLRQNFPDARFLGSLENGTLAAHLAAADVFAGHPIGVLDEDLRSACLQALELPREACRTFAMDYSWENSARQFVNHARKVADNSRDLETAVTVAEEAAPV
jgi:glycosyltransferase involved in cell wall biosynthesis